MFKEMVEISNNIDIEIVPEKPLYNLVIIYDRLNEENSYIVANEVHGKEVYINEKKLGTVNYKVVEYSKINDNIKKIIRHKKHLLYPINDSINKAIGSTLGLATYNFYMFEGLLATYFKDKSPEDKFISRGLNTYKNAEIYNVPLEIKKESLEYIFGMIKDIKENTKEKKVTIIIDEEFSVIEETYKQFIKENIFITTSNEDYIGECPICHSKNVSLGIPNCFNTLNKGKPFLKSSIRRAGLPFVLCKECAVKIFTFDNYVLSKAQNTYLIFKEKILNEVFNEYYSKADFKTKTVFHALDYIYQNTNKIEFDFYLIEKEPGIVDDVKISEVFNYKYLREKTMLEHYKIVNLIKFFLDESYKYIKTEVEEFLFSNIFQNEFYANIIETMIKKRILDSKIYSTLKKEGIINMEGLENFAKDYDITNEKEFAYAVGQLHYFICETSKKKLVARSQSIHLFSECKTIGKVVETLNEIKEKYFSENKYVNNKKYRKIIFEIMKFGSTNENKIFTHKTTMIAGFYDTNLFFQKTESVDTPAEQPNQASTDESPQNM